MWSTCSIDTGHSRTQAPQVTQSQTTSSVTAFGTSGAARPSAPAQQRRPVLEDLVAQPHDQQLRRQLLAGRVQAGQTSWQRPHSVHEKVSSICFQVMSATVPAPEAHLLLGHVGRRSAAAPAGPRGARAPEEHVHRGGDDVQVLRVGQVGEEAQDDQHVRPHEDALEDLRRAAPSPNRCESAFATGDQRAGHSFSPSAMRVACHSSSVVTMPAIMRQDQVGLAQVAALEARRPLHLADHDRARPRPTSTSTANRSTRNANQPWWPSHGQRGVAGRPPPIIAITIVGNSTRKPQKMNGVHQARAPAAGAACAGRARPRPRCARARGTSPERVGRRARPHQPHQQPGAAREQAAARRRARPRAERVRQRRLSRAAPSAARR